MEDTDHDPAEGAFELSNKDLIQAYFSLPPYIKLKIVSSLGIYNDFDYSNAEGIDLDKIHLRRAIDNGLINKVWELIRAYRRDASRVLYNAKSFIENTRNYGGRNEITGCGEGYLNPLANRRHLVACVSLLDESFQDPDGLLSSISMNCEDILRKPLPAESKVLVEGIQHMVNLLVRGK